MGVKPLKFIDIFEIEPTNFCNAQCVFCPRNALKRPRGYMTWDTFKTIVDKATELNIKNLIFSGFGEPFLHKDLLEYISYLNEKAPHVNLEIITNCSLLTPEKIEQLKMLKVNQLVISFSGIDEKSYESQMKNLSYAKVISNLNYLAQNGGELAKKVRIRPVITKVFDFPQFKIMQKNLMQLGFKAENLAEYYLCANRGGYLIDKNIYDDVFLKNKGVALHNPEGIMCLMFIKTLQIAWNGDILLCCCDINDETNIGNINTSTLQEIHNKILYFRTPETKPPICLRCNAPFVYKGYEQDKKLGAG